MDGEVSVSGLSWSNFIAPLIVAVVVGVGSSYMTTKMQIGALQQRVSRVQSDISRLRSRADAQDAATNEFRERVIRMETKIDLLLRSQGIEESAIRPNN